MKVADSSAGAVRGVRVGPLDSCRDAVVRETDRYVGWRSWGLGSRRGRPPPLNRTVPESSGWTGGGTADGTAAGS